MKSLMSILSVLFFLYHPSGYSKTLAIIGDSIPTGAVSSHKLSPNVPSLFKNLFVRGMWDFEATEGGINFPQNSFAQILGELLGSKSVITAAKNGQRVETIYEQFEKVVKLNQGSPDDFVISYTANDACAMGIFQQSKKEFRTYYKQKLLYGAENNSGLIKMLSQIDNKKEVRVILIAPLNFNLVLKNRSILDLKIAAGAGSQPISCLNLRAGQSDPDKLSLVAQKLVGMCPAILSTDPLSQEPEQVERRAHLEDIHATMIEVQREVVEELKAVTHSNIKLFFIESVGNLDFVGKHVANDCFHLSAQGQGFLAFEVWKSLYPMLMN